MTDRTLNYFRTQSLIDGADAALVRWSHAVNSRNALTQALSGPNHMIEADVILSGDGSCREPIMAHPPDTDSDITLREWLQEVQEHQKGVKLDFKSLDAVAPSLALLENLLAETNRPVWINADILRGPGAEAEPLDPDAFLSAVKDLPAQTVLSLGWTTGWSTERQNPGYSWQMVHVMEEKCRHLKHCVTFPVRAAMLSQSFSQLAWLLHQSDRYTLTVWTGQFDEFTTEELLSYRTKFEKNRIFYDLPEAVTAELRDTSQDGH